MKNKALLLLSALCLAALSGFSQPVTTTGDQSPAVVAATFSGVYGVRADAVEALMKIYEKNGLGPADRKSRTEALLKKYQQAPEKKKGAPLLSDATKKDLGLSPEEAEVFDWDLFARKYYLATTGYQSPAVYAPGGEVSIWYGIPPKVVRALADFLEKNKVDLADLGKRLEEQVKKYEELKAEFGTYGPTDPIVKKAEQLLEEGKLLEVEKLIDSDYAASKKRQAYKGFLFGKTKELLLKYDTAAVGYRDAVFLDPINSQYLLAYADNEHTCARYDEAIEYYQKSLAIDTIVFKDQPDKAALLYNNLGEAYRQKSEYDRAIQFFEKALSILVQALEEKQPNIAAQFNNLGTVWEEKGEYDRAIWFYEKALAVDSVAFGNKHPNVAGDFNNLGSAWQEKGEYDRAIQFFEKALAIDSVAFGNKHPNVATYFNNLGSAWKAKGEYGRAIQFFEKALAIDSVIFENKHPAVARELNNLGSAWQSKGEYDRAIQFFEKALPIFVQAYGENHPNVAIQFNNLGTAYGRKGEYDRAIAFSEKALAIDSVAYGNKHPDVAIDLNNLGKAYCQKGEYDRAIAFFEDALDIFKPFLGNSHPSTKKVAGNLSRALGDRGAKFSREKNYAAALLYFQKALENAEAAEDWILSITCLDNIGSTYKQLGRYTEGLAALEKGIARAQDLDQKSGKPEHTDVIRRLRYHKAGCLAGLGRKKEADELYRQLLKEAREANDTRLLEDLKNDGIE